ncbi:MAG: hypothetical protein AB1346_07205 [Thermodesulfobacteriota bacterium]
MVTLRARLAASLLALAFLCAPAAAQTLFDVGPARTPRIHEHPPGHRPANVHSRIYSFSVLPGACTLNFSFPAAAVRLKPQLSVFDRWPYDPAARRYDLPMGPLAAGGGKRIEYRWSMDISPASSGTRVYVVVEFPSAADGTGPFPHEIYIAGPAPSPVFRAERGVTALAGPSGLVLSDGREPAPQAADRSDGKSDSVALPSLPAPGDLLRNGSFRDGLNHWTPHRERVAAEDVRSFSLADGVLKIRAPRENAREGVMQHVNADVSGAASVVLAADVQVREQTQGGLGAEGRDAPIAVAVAYRGASGGEESAGRIFWKGFYALERERPGGDADGQKVPRGQWHRVSIDLMQLDPKPATILFISLEGSGWPSREGWVRNVHLIKSGVEK